MSLLLTQLREELATNIELLSQKKTAAEKACYDRLVFTHNELVKIEVLGAVVPAEDIAKVVGGYPEAPASFAATLTAVQELIIARQKWLDEQKKTAAETTPSAATEAGSPPEDKPAIELPKS